MQQPMTGDGDKPAIRLGWANQLGELVRSPTFKRVTNISKILLGVGLLILSVWGIRWESLASGIRSADAGWIVIAVCAVLVGLALKLWRWVIFVRNYQIKASYWRLFSAYFLGQAVNIVLPFRGGELVRLGYFAGEPKLLPDVISSIALEKYLDLLGLTVCAILVSLQFSLENILNVRGWLLPLTGLLTLCFLAAVVFGPSLWGTLRTWRRLPIRLADGVERWIQVSRWLRNPRQVLPGVWLTGLIWGVMWVTNVFLFKGLRLPLGGTAAGLVLILVYIGLLPALMPGNIGPFYFFARLALLPFGVLSDQALVFAVLLHFIVTLPALLAGAIGLLVSPRRVVAS